jgi:light-regulated signal transduction histidine kinase (bacteriophytochrome)
MKANLEVLSRRYEDAINAYLADAGEATLSFAYELGRAMLADGVGLLELITVHHRALEALVVAAPSPQRASLVLASSEFLRELLSPFEMTFRGYREANEQLRVLNESLARQKGAVETANRELESFSYSVSHDLRAPLRSIEGFSEALLEDCADRLHDQDKKHLSFIREAAQHMTELIDDLLELARIGRIDPSPMRVDLTSLARRITERLHAAERGREVDWIIEERLFGFGDARLLELVLQNLLGNAWKFTAKREHARIELGQLETRGKVAFFVRDNGAGFDMSYSKKLFRIFQRLHAPTEFSGTGVGLAIVQRIVHRHGGEVWAEGEVDRGATFYFTLGGTAEREGDDEPRNHQGS